MQQNDSLADGYFEPGSNRAREVAELILHLPLDNLAAGETVILLHPPLPLVAGVSTATMMECQQSDGLAAGCCNLSALHCLLQVRLPPAAASVPTSVHSLRWSVAAQSSHLRKCRGTISLSLSPNYSDRLAYTSGGVFGGSSFATQRRTERSLA